MVEGAIKRAFSGKNLFYTNVLLSICISTTGDCFEQLYELYKKDIVKYDYARNVQMGFSGSIAGCICHHWYKILDKIIIGQSFQMALKKIFLDQFVSSPVIILSFFASVALFEENPVENFTDEVKSKFWTLYKAEWVVWPPAQLINFYLLPLRYRVLFDNCVSLGYDVYTSHVKHDKSKWPDH